MADSDPFFKAHISGHDYRIEKMDLDALCLMAERFNMPTIADFDPTDPRQLKGLLFLALRREGVGEHAALEAVGRIDFMDLLEMMQDQSESVTASAGQVTAEAEQANRPTDAAPAAGKPKGGKSGTARKKAGSPS